MTKESHSFSAGEAIIIIIIIIALSKEDMLADADLCLFTNRLLLKKEKGVAQLLSYVNVCVREKEMERECMCV